MGTAQNPPSITPQDYPTQTLEQEIPGVAPFTFNWVEEVQKAYNALEDFYNKLLDFAGGDLDLAKRMLAYSYSQGIRETGEAFESQIGELGREKEIEVPRLQTAQNRRGTFFSGFGGRERDIQTEGYGARQLAIEREKENKESRLRADYEFGGEEAQTSFNKRKFDLERERRKEAQEMAGYQRNVKADIYGAELGRASQEEMRSVQNKTAQATGQIGSQPAGPEVTQGGATGRVADSTGRLYGGWYDNPQTGKNQRYWGNNVWTDN
jgi:hypothetical protein